MNGICSSSASYLEERRSAYPAMVHAERLKIRRVEDDIELPPTHDDVHTYHALFSAVAGYPDLDIGRAIAIAHWAQHRASGGRPPDTV